MARTFFQRSLRRLMPGLLVVLPVILALGVGPARAAESAASGKVAREHHVSTKSTYKKSKRRRKAARRYAPAPPSMGQLLGLHKTPDALRLASSAVLVVDQDTGETITAKNADVVLPVASLTKLMTALIVVEAVQPLDEVLMIGSEDVDTEKKTRSRLRVGTRLTRDEMLLLALMSSENRAANALSRHYPGGRPAFLAQMNLRAQQLGMSSTHFADAAGLSPRSVSTARDLQRLLGAADMHPLIRNYSTQREGLVKVNGRALKFINSNRLVRKSTDDWTIALQKTGFTNEAGRCLVMTATVLNRRLGMIFLDSSGTLTRYADAARVRKVLEQEQQREQRTPAAASAATAAAS